MTQKLEFYQYFYAPLQMNAVKKQKRRYIKKSHNYIKEEDERSMTNEKRQAWLKEMNDRGF